MPDFVERFSGESREMLCSSADANGSPHTLVVCAAAIRAADLARYAAPVLHRSCP